MTDSKTSKRHEERREYPRIVLDSPVNILYKMHNLEAKIHDISPDGLQIRTDKDSLNKIAPDDLQKSQTNTPLLDVTFRLKLYEMDMIISALCEMYYTNQLKENSDSEFACGLKFINFEGDGSSQLEAFITQEMNTF